MDAPKLGDTKPCIIDRCDGTMERKSVRPPDAYAAGEGAQLPERLPDYEAWVCETCGFEQKGSH